MHVPVKEMVAEVEPALGKIPQQEAEKVRIAVTNLLRVVKPPSSNITRTEREAIRSLAADKELIVLPADKGNATVIWIEVSMR